MPTAEIRARAEAVAATAPPLTVTQKDQLISLLRPAVEGTRRKAAA